MRQPPENDDELRKALLWFVGAFANWDMAAHASYLEVWRKLVQAAHGEEAPPPRPAGRPRRHRAGAPRGRHSAAGVAGPRQAGGDVGEDARLRGGGGREREYERGDGRVAGGAVGRCIWCPPSGRRGAGAK